VRFYVSCLTGSVNCGDFIFGFRFSTCDLLGEAAVLRKADGKSMRVTVAAQIDLVALVFPFFGDIFRLIQSHFAERLYRL
jgi:hypothetical protein